MAGVMHALVDFDNAADLSRLGRRVRLPDIEHVIGSTVSWLGGFGRMMSPCPQEVVVRLYGGWHDATNNQMTALHSFVAASVRSLPRRQSGVRIRPSVVTSMLVNPGDPLLHTVRVRRQLPRILIDEPAGCANRASCTLASVRTWLRRGCDHPGCPVRARDVFSVQEQKTIDTTITCDILFLAQASPEDWIVVVSDDDDLVPGLLAARQFTNHVALVRRRPAALYDSLLASYHVIVNTDLPNFF